jgi:hypothetical protein
LICRGVAQRFHKGYAGYFSFTARLPTAIPVRNEATSCIQGVRKALFLGKLLAIQLIAFRQPPGQ